MNRLEKAVLRSRCEFDQVEMAEIAVADAISEVGIDVVLELAAARFHGWESLSDIDRIAFREVAVILEEASDKIQARKRP
jgi:hypothetical protein